MLPAKVARICDDIRALKIQGARRIARAGIQAIALRARLSTAKNVDALSRELIEAADCVARARPTEPMLRNSIRFLFTELRKRKKSFRSVDEMKKAVLEEEKTLLARFEENARKIAEYGAEEIGKGETVLVHCHSSTVMGVLKLAHRQGKRPRVIATESRPFFQGHMTARELSGAGLDVTMIVDDAVKSFMHGVDKVMVGADAITSTGDLVNKIGTATIASVACESDVPVFSCAEFYKFDPATLWGRPEPIEERDPREVADPKKFPKVKIRNPAFDVTHAKYLEGYITEKGVLSPSAFVGIAMKEFGL
mgnify:CR=1 FL=1